MASIVLNIAGGALGGPIGAALGSIVGAAIDSLIVGAISGGQKQRIEGARLQDLRVTSSSEGAVIPRVYGRMRLGGNIIWATDFREEVRVTETGGGKGGGGGGITTTEYLYFCSFAVAICEGPIAGIGRIWADGKPFNLPGAVYRVYPGDEAQEADPLIVSFMGEENTPAYRGTAYIVFDDLPLEKFGNRIPQLSFEVYRPLTDENSAENLIRSVNMIPGAGEFVYATEKVTRNVLSGVQNAATASENVNSNDPEGRPDFMVSLDQLEAICPNIENVSLVVSWFGTDLRCGNCLIKPGVENDSKVTSIPWAVDGVQRDAAHVVSTLPNGNPAYGGTPADFSVVQAIQELKQRGLRVTFYPFVMMDIPADNDLPDPYSANAGETGQPVYPWRGRITCSPAPGFTGSPDKTGTAATQVAAFFGDASPSDFSVSGETVSWAGGDDWGFRRMVLHYAHLCAAAGGVDTFIIASEMRGLTWVRSAAGTYPAVAELVSLAADCRSILGVETKISYAADWSEYFGHHPQDGSGDVYFHLDPLWADANIDFIGIDNYMPLSDWRDGYSHADAQAGVRSIYDLAYLQSNVEGGEGYDWYYASDADRASQTRTDITDGEGKPWVFRYKDIRNWWANQHFNRPGGEESNTPTDWVPESKPIRFTEAGCPAIDKGTNQPNVFVDPKSSESFFPYFSRGARDDFIQRCYIEALYLYWADNNPVSGVYDGPMLEMGDLSIWTWDARPYPTFPARSDIWGDWENWNLGHWLTGRLGASSLAAVVRDICQRAGLDNSLMNVSGLAGLVPGYRIEAIESARASLEPLARYYAFDSAETGGVIQFVHRGGIPAATVTADDLVASRQAESDDLELTRGQETELPLALKWRLVRADEEYGGFTVEARRITVDTARIASENFALAAIPAEADARCRRALFEEWIGRDQARFALPPSWLAVDPTDVLLLQHDGRFQEYRVGSVSDGDARAIDAGRTDAVLYGARPGPQRQPSLPVPTVYGSPTAALLDLPILNDTIPAHRPYAAVHASPWYGQAAVYRSATQEGFSLIDAVTRPAVIGVLNSDFYGSGAAARNFDLANQLIIDLISGTLTSVSDLAMFEGANAVAIESESGVWEIVQFGNAELIAAGRYRCTRLLRGQKGTEGAMRNPAPAGARVVVLNEALRPISIGEGDLGNAYNWRIGPASLPADDAAYTAIAFTPTGVGLRPYAPSHAVQPYKFARSPGDLTIAWKRRTRAPAGDSWGGLDVPLYEETELYEVDVLDGQDVLRTLSSSAPSVTYAEADQVTDWGAALEAGDSLDIAIYQLSPGYGRGAPYHVTLFF